VRYLLSLGSNLGDKKENIREALSRLAARGVTVEARSSLYLAAPVDAPPQEDFCNAAALIGTTLPPEGLLDLIGAVEREMGRVRAVRNGPRVIDIDIVLAETGSYRSARLELPHPRWRGRRFVVEPAREIAGREGPFARELASVPAERLETQRVTKIEEPLP